MMLGIINTLLWLRCMNNLLGLSNSSQVNRPTVTACMPVLTHNKYTRKIHWLEMQVKNLYYHNELQEMALLKHKGDSAKVTRSNLWLIYGFEPRMFIKITFHGFVPGQTSDPVLQVCSQSNYSTCVLIGPEATDGLCSWFSYYTAHNLLNSIKRVKLKKDSFSGNQYKK